MKRYVGEHRAAESSGVRITGFLLWVFALGFMGFIVMLVWLLLFHDTNPGYLPT